MYRGNWEWTKIINRSAQEVHTLPPFLQFPVANPQESGANACKKINNYIALYHLLPYKKVAEVLSPLRIPWNAKSHC